MVTTMSPVINSPEINPFFPGINTRRITTKSIEYQKTSYNSLFKRESKHPFVTV